MIRYFLLLFVLIDFSVQSQALRDINYRYLYNPNENFLFNIKAAQTASEWVAIYKLAVQDTAVAKPNEFWIQWELRNGLNEKEGRVIQADSVVKNGNTLQSLSGRIVVSKVSSTQILVAKVINNTLKRAWIFYKILDPNYPVNGILTQYQDPVLTPYIKVNAEFNLEGNDSLRTVSYYNENFPASVPAFSESAARVSRGMRVDSTFTIDANQPLRFSEKGLYLIQADTNALKGIAFRVEDDYPKLAKLESLADPLIYICSRQEFERVKLAKGDKRAFDKVILTITGDAGRARTLIRNYFRRVELANEYFTSYKEGWKTDRGMIYIVFGLPDEVYKFQDRELWSYKNNAFKVDFEFVKSSTLFDPDNFVLIRKKKYEQTWYEVVDLWRNARF